MKSVLLALALATVALSAADIPPLIPLPKELQQRDGSFAVYKPEILAAIRYDGALENEAKLFEGELEARFHSPLKMVKEEAKIRLPQEIHLDLDPSLSLGPGGYTLEVAPDKVVIKGKDAAGAWYGTRSILQMLPPKGDETWATTKGIYLPAVSITDEPRFQWRGMMLDSGRHFIPVENVKGFIDWLAFHKFNRLHWHLTDDQGWRIEIKKYPKLTEVGAYRDSTPPYGNRNSDDGKRYGGFYTQEQIKEVVAYATERHITVMPEIDMPGHMAAAIAAYPQLGNSDIPDYAPKVANRWGVHPYILAPTEETFGFIDDVLTELCGLFPSEYIHIGGDEAPKDQWEKSPRVKALMEKEHLKNGHDVQSYFIKRVEKILEAKNRKLIGWDEIREGGLSPQATVMSWRGEDGGIASAKEGHDVVMASNTHLYLDHYQAPGPSELAKNVNLEEIGGFQPIYHVYEYDPVPHSLTKDEAKHVLGVQAQLWAEYMHDWKKVEYQAFPRIAAVAEVAWTPVNRKNYDSFRSRLTGIMKHYDAAGVNRGEPYEKPTKITRDDCKVTTTLKMHQENWPELIYDGKVETFFWAEKGASKDDEVVLNFAKPFKGGKVKVVTGGAKTNNGDILESGVLEASADGKTWKECGTFDKGIGTGALPEGDTSFLRIRVTAPQETWIMFREVTID
ncbi:MAG: beta-N-acetylglucosaminidase [Akkermansiaceae bacterium]|nr:beta-N-acetylglucosaminidase [Akkermansiaceae bacterium]